MAQKTTLIDDLDQTPAEETVSFSVDGASYEIDLNKANAKKLRDAFARYSSAGRRVSGRVGRGRAAGRRAGRARSAGGDTAAVRAWAKSKGIKVSERGRIPASVVEKYRAANR